MELNSISQQTQLIQLLSQLQSISTSSGNDSNSQFSMLLEDMLKNTTANNSVNAAGSNTLDSMKNSDAGGLGNLSLSPQSLIRMIQMDMNSSTVGSVDDDSMGDDNASDGLSMFPTEGTDMSELLQIMMESLKTANSSNSQDANLSNQPGTGNTAKTSG